MKIHHYLLNHRYLKGYSEENISLEMCFSQTQYSMIENAVILFSTDELSSITNFLDIKSHTLISRDALQKVSNKHIVNIKMF